MSEKVIILEKVKSQCGKLIYFGVQTPKGTQYFGEDVKNLTPFIRNKSTDLVSINGEITPIHSMEQEANSVFKYFLEDGRTLILKPKTVESGNSSRDAYFDKKWK